MAASTNFSFVTSTGGAKLSSSNTPFYIPIHFDQIENGQSSKSTKILGPQLPSKDWRHSWQKPTLYNGQHISNLPNGLKRLAKKQPQHAFEDDGLNRWVTSMEVWNVEGNEEEGAQEDEHSSINPQIRITSKEHNTNSPDIVFGNHKGGRRIAVGTHDGNVWIFEEQTQEPQTHTSYESANMTPSTSATGFNTLPYRSSPNRSRLSLVSPTSPTTSMSRAGERDAILPTSATTDISVSAAPNHSTNSGMDAEEQLELQWHSGRENQTSMMGGMMEALGIQQGNQSHENIHSHHHDAKKHGHTDSPTREKHLRHSRSRNISLTLGSSQKNSNDIKSALAKAGLIGTLGTGNQEEREEGTQNDQPACHSNKPLESVEPILCFQCPTRSPIVSLRFIPIGSGKESLSILQEDGTLTLWSLEGALQAFPIDLKTAKAIPLDRLHDEAQTQPAASFMSPLARLAAMRSNAPSPQPRSRVNSNASQPASTETISLPVVSTFEGVTICRSNKKGVKAFSVIDALYDKAKMRLSIVDAEKQVVTLQHSFEDIGLAPPLINVCEDEETVDVYHINTSGSVEVESHRIKSKRKPTINDTQKLAPLSSTSAFLRREGLSRPTSRPASILEETPITKRILGDNGVEKDARGLFVIREIFILTWSDEGISLAKRSNDSLSHSDTLSIQGLIDIQVDEESILLQTEDKVLLIQITEKGQFVQQNELDLEYECDAVSIKGNGMHPILCLRDEDERLSLHSQKSTIWQGLEPIEQVHVTATLPFSMERVVLSLSSGHLTICPLIDLVDGHIPEPKNSTSTFSGTVTLLQTVTNPRTNSRHIIGGTEEGDIIMWDATTLKCQMQRSILTSPIVAFVAIGNQDNALRLHGSVACIAADSTIAFIMLDELQLLYIVPGRNAPLELMAVRSNELMTIYADGRARVWSATDLELRRSIGVDQALVLLEDGKGWWSQFPIDVAHLKRERGNVGVLSSIPSSRSSFSGTMTADIRRIVEAASRMVASLNTTGVSNARDFSQAQDLQDLDVQIDPMSSLDNKSAPKSSFSQTLLMPQAAKALHTLRPLLCSILPFGLSQEFDEQCKLALDIKNDIGSNTNIACGLFTEPGYLIMSLHGMTSRQMLCISPALTATRVIGSIAMLLVLSNIVELQKPAYELITQLGSLSNIVGKGFQPPSIEFLIGFLTDPVLEIKQAAQMLFVSSLEGMPQEDLDQVCAQFSGALPNRRRANLMAAPPPMKDSERGSIDAVEDEREDQHSSKALLLLGLIATQRYTVMPPNLLKDISASISIYLNDEYDPAHQSIAIVLCDRGFSIFQHYFDAMEIVRTMFSLSTILPKGDNTSENGTSKAAQVALENRDLARQATLRIAEENTPLFMTTLSLDILHARSPEHCSATMRLVAFMVRRKPLVLYPNLPRFAEAVVKSLDPTVTTLRPVIHKSATIIISELISAYPTIAFHKGLQRLAVGTFEGAIIMYDLKTATRLYVLEAHSASLNGLTFSNDGRRLVSICLSDGMVKIWKTGVGLGSIFNFGGAPRQISALLGRATGSGEPEQNQSSTPNQGGGHTNQHSHNHVGTPAYKSFDFGRMAGSALASVRLAAIRSPPLSGSSTHSGGSVLAGGGLLSPRGSISSHASLVGREEEEAAFLSDLQLVRFEWLAERSIKIRIGEASLVFDVA